MSAFHNVWLLLALTVACMGAVHANVQFGTCYVPYPYPASNCCQRTLCKQYGCKVNNGPVTPRTPCDPLNQLGEGRTWMFCEETGCDGDAVDCGACHCGVVWGWTKQIAIKDNITKQNLFYAFTTGEVTSSPFNAQCIYCGEEDAPGIDDALLETESCSKALPDSGGLEEMDDSFYEDIFVVDMQLLCETNLPDQAIPHNDLNFDDAPSTDSWEECRDLCEADSACHGVTWDASFTSDGRYCFTKGEFADADTIQPWDGFQSWIKCTDDSAESPAGEETPAETPAGEETPVEVTPDENFWECDTPCSVAPLEDTVRGYFEDALPDWVPEFIAQKVVDAEVDILQEVITGINSDFTCQTVTKTGAQILSIDEGLETPTASACAGVPVEAVVSYWSEAFELVRSATVEYGFCPGIRVCADSFDIFVGISQCTPANQVCVEVVLADIPLGEETLVVKLGAFAVSTGGVLEASSADSESRALILDNASGTIGLIDQNAHVYLKGEIDTDVGLQIGGEDVLTVNVKSVAEVSVNMDPETDGVQPTEDLEVMLVGELETVFQLLKLSIELPVHAGAVLHWRRGPGGWTAEAAIGAGLGLTTDQIVQNLAGGEIGEKIAEFLGHAEANLEIEFQISALSASEGHQWGLRLAFEAEIDLGDNLPDLVVAALDIFGIKDDDLVLKGGIRVLEHFNESVTLGIEGNDEEMLVQFSFDCFTHDHCPVGAFCDAWTAVTDPLKLLQCLTKKKVGEECYNDAMCDTSCLHEDGNPVLGISDGDGEWQIGSCAAATFEITEQTDIANLQCSPAVYLDTGPIDEDLEGIRDASTYIDIVTNPTSCYDSCARSHPTGLVWATFVYQTASEFSECRCYLDNFYQDIDLTMALAPQPGMDTVIYAANTECNNA